MYLPLGWFASSARVVCILRLGGLHLPWKTFPWCSFHYKPLHGFKIEAAIFIGREVANFLFYTLREMFPDFKSLLAEN